MAYSPDPLIHRRDGGALRRSTRRAGNNDARTPRQLRSATRTRGNRGVSDLPAGELVANAPRKKRRPARKAATRNDAQPDRRGDNEGTRTTASSRSTQRNRRAPQHSSKVDDTDERDKHDAQPDLEGDVTGAQEGGPSTEQLAAEEEFLLKFERNPDRKILRYSMAKPPADFVSLAESSNQNGAAEWCIGSAMVGHSPTRGNNRRAVSDGSMHAGTEQPPTGFNADRTATSRAGPDAVLSPSAGTASPADKGGEQRAGAPGPSSASPALSAAASDASESSADGDSAQSGANDVGPHNALQLGHGNSVRKVSMAPPSPPGGEESFVPPTSVVTPSKPCAATLADREAWQKQVEEQLLLKVQREFKERRLEDRREFQQLQMEYRRLLREERERNAAKHAATNARLETITEDQQLGAQRSEQLIREERKRNDAKHAANGKRFTNFKRDLVNSYEAIRDIQDDNEARDQANKQLAATVAENRRRQDERTNQLADTMAENRRRQDEATQQLAATVEANRREFESTAKEIREVMEKRHDKYEAESATLRSMCRGLLNEMKDVHTFRDRMGVRVEDLEGALSKLEGKRDELERIPATKKHTKDIVAFAQSTVLDEMEDVNSLKTVHFVKALADAHQGRFVAPSTIVKHLKGRGDKEPLTKEELKDIIVAILFGYTLNPLQLGRSYTDEDPSPKEIGAEVLTALGYKERGEANMNNIYKKLKKDKRVPKKREVTNGAVYFWYEGGPWKRMDKPSRRPTFSVPVA